MASRCAATAEVEEEAEGAEAERSKVHFPGSFFVAAAVTDGDLRRLRGADENDDDAAATAEEEEGEALERTCCWAEAPALFVSFRVRLLVL